MTTLNFLTGVGEMALEHVPIGAEHTCDRNVKASGALPTLHLANAGWEAGIPLYFFYVCPTSFVHFRPLDSI